MIYIVVLIVLGLILIGLIAAISSGSWGAEPLALIVAILVFFFALASPAIFAASTGEKEELSRSNLGALALGDETSGSFFLGSGVVDEETVFTYVLDRGGYSTVETIETQGARIVEEDTDAPYLVTYGSCLKAGFLVPFDVCEGSSGYTEFHIPAGSIVRDYTVDVG